MVLIDFGKFQNIVRFLILLVYYINLLTSCFEFEDQWYNVLTYEPNHELSFVKGGKFLMGCTTNLKDCRDNELPVHEVKVDDFYISKFEITNKQFSIFLNEYNYDTSKNNNKLTLFYPHRWGIKRANSKWVPNKGRENCPAVYITWYGAKAYADFYSLDLPTEAEWEYAARGGILSNSYLYSGSNTLSKVAIYTKTSRSPGKGKLPQPNELGLYNMSGSVWEWCSDWYHEDYTKIIGSKDLSISNNHKRKVLRGGSFVYYGDQCRVSYRLPEDPNGSIFLTGFRCVKRVNK